MKTPAANEFLNRCPVCEEVYGMGYDTAGNLHWYGTYTGHHEVKMEGEHGIQMQEKDQQEQT